MNRIRRYWPILAVVAGYLFCQALLQLAKWLVNHTVGFPYFGTDYTVVPGLTFFVSIFFAVRLALLGRRRIFGVIFAVLVVSLQAFLIYELLTAASAASYLAETRFDHNPRLALLPARAMEVRNGRGGASAARFYFQDTGVAVPFRDEAGAVHMFEPTPKQTEAWDRLRESRGELEGLRPFYRAHAAALRWAGYSNIFLSLAAILLAVGLSRRPTPHVPAET